jgi:hypothetical protein
MAVGVLRISYPALRTLWLFREASSPADLLIDDLFMTIALRGKNDALSIDCVRLCGRCSDYHGLRIISHLDTACPTILEDRSISNWLIHNDRKEPFLTPNRLEY